ncbi:MAG: MauE/DoxX family redox-associated membrane protein [Thermodesulfobacteriota bacterium]
MNRVWTVLRVCLGLLFVLASLDKIAHPALFAQAVANYRILPEALVNPAAILLPWVEAVAGLALACGVFTRGAALVVAGLMLTFCGALAANLARGIDVACGCFTVDPLAAPDMRWYALRDGAILLLSLAVLWRTFRQGSPGRS